MLTAAVIVYALAAIGGATIAFLSFTDRKIPKYIAVGHGFGTGLATLLLLIAVLSGATGGLVITSLILFVLAIFGGLYLYFGFYVPYKPLPKGMIVLHGLLALAGLVLLISGAAPR